MFAGCGLNSLSHAVQEYKAYKQNEKKTADNTRSRPDHSGVQFGNQAGDWQTDLVVSLNRDPRIDAKIF